MAQVFFITSIRYSFVTIWEISNKRARELSPNLKELKHHCKLFQFTLPFPFSYQKYTRYFTNLKNCMEALSTNNTPTDKEKIEKNSNVFSLAQSLSRFRRVSHEFCLRLLRRGGGGRPLSKFDQPRKQHDGRPITR